ncbi:MAG: signal peptide peptidase SppA [Candidatus Micrarchaeia archaeon]
MDNKNIIIAAGAALFILLAAIAVVAASAGSSGDSKGSLGGGLGSIFNPGCVGVIDISGEITTQDSPAGLFSQGVSGSQTIADQIRQADGDDSVKAILLTIDSPGGSVVATQEIYDALEKSKKPKVAYFRETAASGGYYVGAAADYIVSEPAALTGSIGVRATVTDLSPLFEKIGYNETTFKSGQFKDMGDYARPMTDGEKAIFQSIVDEIFQDFKAAVLKHRAGKIDTARLGEIFDARVMTGRQALSYGLVDKVGNEDDALQKAAQLGGLEYSDKPDTCSFSSRKGSLLEDLFASSAYSFGRGIAAALGGSAQSVRLTQ